MTVSLSVKPARNILLISVIALLIVFGGMFILHAVPVAAKSRVADGFLADLVVTFPVFFYFVIIRPLKIRTYKLLFVVSICCGVAYLILPQQQREYILQIRKFTALAELLFIGYAVVKIKELRKAYRINQTILADPIYNLRAAMAAVLGESLGVKIIASEIAVLRYGLLFWKKEKAVLGNSTAISTHKEFGYIAIWCVLLLGCGVEITALHLLLMRWSHLAANIVTALSSYGLVFFMADLSAILKRKVLFNDEQIILRTGLRWRMITTIDNISAVQKISSDYQSDDVYFKGGINKKGGNVLICFKAPVMADKLYGASKPYNSVLMHVDDVNALAALVR